VTRGAAVVLMLVGVYILNAASGTTSWGQRASGLGLILLSMILFYEEAQNVTF